MTLKEYKLWVEATMETLKRTDSMSLEEALFIIAKLDDVSVFESIGTPIPTLPITNPLKPIDIWPIPPATFGPTDILCGTGISGKSESIKTSGYATFPSNVHMSEASVADIQECADLEFGNPYHEGFSENINEDPDVDYGGGFDNASK